MEPIKKRTKLFSIYTDELYEIKQVFSTSIQDDWDIHIEYMGTAGDGDGDFASKGFYHIQRKKIEFIMDMIKENWNDVIIYADIDIQFFDRCSELIERAIDGKDFVFQAEYPSGNEVNVGFSVIRCNEKTLAVYNSILNYDFEALPIADQSAMNDILKGDKSDLHWGLLPTQFWAMSHYMNDQTIAPPDMVLHHANCTRPRIINGERVGSVQLKLEQFQMMRNYIAAQKELKVVIDIQQSGNSGFSSFFSAIANDIENEPANEETCITYAFYLHVSLINTISSFSRKIVFEVPALYNDLMDELFLPLLDKVEIKVSYEQNKDMLSEIYQDVQNVGSDCLKDIPGWLFRWVELCKNRLLEQDMNNVNYRASLKTIGRLINLELNLPEKSKYILSYFIREIFLQMVQPNLAVTYS